MDRAYTVDILNSESDLRAIAADWHKLWCEDNSATPFQSPHWNLAWWQHLNPGGELAVATIRSRSGLVALAPWWLSNDGRTGRRTLTFLGRGISDYHDVLRRQDDEMDRLADILRRTFYRLDWDECDLNELSGNSTLIGYCTGELADCKTKSSACPVLQFSDACNSIDRAVSRGAARSLCYYQRRLARLHKFEIEAASGENVHYLLAELFRLHGELWSARGQSGVLCGKEMAEFHHKAASGLLRDGALRLYLLRIDSRSAAVFYGFCCHQRTYYYLGGFSPEFARLNPGTLLIGYAIEQALKERSREFDFLRGGEHYKYWWGARDRFSYRLRLSRTTPEEK